MDETDKQWIISIEKRANGQDNFDTLRHHYSGKGNTSRRIEMSDNLWEKLQFKSERAMSFNMFLDIIHNMFSIFRDKGGQMDNSM